jgi:deoxyribodipyrimidine photolyase
LPNVTKVSLLKSVFIKQSFILYSSLVANIKDFKYIKKTIPCAHLYVWDSKLKDINSLSETELEIKFPVTISGAKTVLKKFIKTKLDNFGKYQDIILDTDHSLIYHAGISPMLNIGLITPINVINEVVKVLKSNNKNLNSDCECFVFYRNYKDNKIVLNPNKQIGWMEINKNEEKYVSSKNKYLRSCFKTFETTDKFRKKINDTKVRAFKLNFMILKTNIKLDIYALVKKINK